MYTSDSVLQFNPHHPVCVKIIVSMTSQILDYPSEVSTIRNETFVSFCIVYRYVDKVSEFAPNSVALILISN